MKSNFKFAPLAAGLAKTLFGIGGLSFFVGGGLIHAETGIDRASAELIGLGIAAGFLILGLIVKGIADNLVSDEEDAPVNPHD